MRLCCSVNPYFKCTGCSWSLCVTCWAATPYGIRYAASDRHLQDTSISETIDHAIMWQDDDNGKWRTIYGFVV